MEWVFKKMDRERLAVAAESVFFLFAVRFAWQTTIPLVTMTVNFHDIAKFT